MATKEQVKNFIDMISPIAQEKVKGRKKWSLPSVCIAQCCCESAYGTSPKMVKANAILGIKVGKSKAHFGKAWKDKAYSTRTKECYDGKTYVNITDMFRAYDSVADAIEDYYDMLASCSRYKGCLNQNDPKKCITAIKNGGYATSPTYINTIMSIIDKYNLTKYDDVVAGKKPAESKRETVRRGDCGEDVVHLQKRLAAMGYGVGKIDGIFGARTEDAVMAFQIDNNLSLDGVVGFNTWTAIGW